MPGSVLSSDYLEYMTDENLIKTVALLSQANDHLRLENDVFILYLSRIQPELLIGLQQAIDSLEVKENRLHAVASLLNNRANESGSCARVSSLAASCKPSNSRTTVSNIPAREAAQIETAHKVEMVSRETEELLKSTNSFRNSTRIIMADRSAATEGLRLATKDIQLFSEDFVARLINGKESASMRVPAEKFVRFIETMIKTTETEITKIRLRTDALVTLGHRVQARLTQKRELGGTLRPVDYKMLKIETDQKLAGLDQAGIYHSELKGSSARSKILLYAMKNTIFEQEVTLSNINKSIMSCEELIKKTMEKSDLARAESRVAEGKLYKLKMLRRDMHVPDTMNYLKVKFEVSSLKKDVKMWTRKIGVQHATLVTYKNRIKMLTRRKKQ